MQDNEENRHKGGCGGSKLGPYFFVFIILLDPFYSHCHLLRTALYIECGDLRSAASERGIVLLMHMEKVPDMHREN